MSAKTLPFARFRLGRIVTTPQALEIVSTDEILSGIARHQAGDWGDVPEEDRLENELSLKRGSRLFSVYHTARNVKFWIITEADRSVTTILLPAEY